MGNLLGKGTVGTNLTINTTSLGTKVKYIRRIIVNAPLSNDDATLKIYKNSASAANLIFDGYMAQRDAGGAVDFKEGVTLTANTTIQVDINVSKILNRTGINKLDINITTARLYRISRNGGIYNDSGSNCFEQPVTVTVG